MLLRFSIILLMSTVLFIGGCPPSREIITENTPAPLGIIKSKTIQGTILGQVIRNPHGVEADRQGRLYLIDAGNGRIIKFDQDLNAVLDHGGTGFSEGLLSNPTYLSLDNNLSLYISDGGNQRISVFDGSLNYIEEISFNDEDNPLDYGRPSGLIADRYGELWVADYDKGRMVIYDNENQPNRFIGGKEDSPGLLVNPTGMTRIAGDRVLVCDEGTGIVNVFSTVGVHRDEYGYGYLDRPSGVVADSVGNIWVSDAGANQIFCFAPNGEYLYSVGEKGRDGLYSFDSPADLAILPGNRLIVSDKGNDRILVYEILYPD